MSELGGNKKYAVFSPDDPLEWHATEEAAIADAKEKMQVFRDEAIHNGEWDVDDEVEQIVVFKATRKVKIVPVDYGCDIECYDARLIEVGR